MALDINDLFLVGRGNNSHKMTAGDVRTFMHEAFGDQITIHKPAALVRTADYDFFRYLSPLQDRADRSDIFTMTFKPPVKSNAALMITTFGYAVMPNDTFDYGGSTLQLARVKANLRFVATGRNAQSVANGTSRFGVQAHVVMPHNPKPDHTGDADFRQEGQLTRIDIVKYDPTGSDITFSYGVDGLKCNAMTFGVGGPQTRISFIPFEAVGTL